MRLLALEKGRAWEQSSSHGSLDSWLQIWNRQVANLQSPGQLRYINVGELGLIWLYKQRAEDQAELNLIHDCNLTGFLNSFLCCWWTEPARHTKSSIATKLLVPLVISEAITLRRHTSIKAAVSLYCCAEKLKMCQKYLLLVAHKSLTLVLTASHMWSWQQVLSIPSRRT